MTSPLRIIEEKRDGGELSPAEIQALIAGYAEGDISDARMAAFAMAVYFRGMSLDETTALADAMLRSGERLNPGMFERPLARMDSTGGGDDKVSLVLLPLAVAAGMTVPTIRNRTTDASPGLLEKLESIPGVRTRFSVSELVNIVRATGGILAEQPESLAPAEQRMASLRRQTGSLPSIPLLAAGIITKWLAAGDGTLVVNIPTGSGAVLHGIDAARQLARMLLGVGRRLGHQTLSLPITEMNEPLGHAIGNILDVREAVEVLRGGGPPDVRALTLALGGEMMTQTGLTPDPVTAAKSLADRLDSGEAWECFIRIVSAQGGDPRSLDNPTPFPIAPVIVDVEADRSGFISRIHVDRIERIARQLGIEGNSGDSRSDPLAGVAGMRRPGDRIHFREPLMQLHARSRERAYALAPHARDAVEITETMPAQRERILETLRAPRD